MNEMLSIGPAPVSVPVKAPALPQYSIWPAGVEALAATLGPLPKAQPLSVTSTPVGTGASTGSAVAEAVPQSIKSDVAARR
ncbi:MAG TPA: hypothetical protein VK570_09875, partial [Rubrivivax sp.]|nr:hypothetical protein [Rubrivivax sp.]